jgi:intein-encoded DNA endonuclease-like protein
LHEKEFLSKDQLTRELETGGSKNEIAAKLGCARGTLRRYLKKHGLYKDARRKYNISKETLERTYLKYWTMTATAKELGIHPTTIHNYLDKYGIERNEKWERRASVDSHYFDLIDSPEKAYWLGYLSGSCLVRARGKNGNSKNIVVSDKQNSRKKHLQKFREAISSDHVIHCRTGTKGCIYHCISITDSSLYSALERHGIRKNRTRTLRYPIGNLGGMDNHYIRGYFDANGRLEFYKGLHMIIGGNMDFLEKMRDVIENGVGLEHHDRVSYHKPGVRWGCILQFRGSLQVQEILYWMYNDAIWNGLKLYDEDRYERMLEKIKRINKQ